MRNSLFLVFFSVLLFISSCTERSVNKEEIQSLLDTSESENLLYTNLEQTLVDSTLFLPPQLVYLETNINSLVSQVDKVLLDSSVIFLLDKKSAKIFKFSDNGRFKTVLNTRGRGPMEYRGIVDMALDQNNKEIYVLCEFPYKIYIYNYDLEFVREIKTNDLYLEFAVMEDVIYCRKAPLHNNKKKKYHVDVLNKHTGEIENSILPIHTEESTDYEDLTLKYGSLLSNHEKVLISLPERNYIYTLNKDSAIAKYTFQQLMVDDAKGAYNLFENKNFLVFINNDLLSIFNKRANKLLGYRYGVFNTKELQGTVNRMAPSNINNGLVFILNSEQIKNGEKRIIEYRDENKSNSYNSTFLQFAQGVNLEDNPILFIYKFK